jgi:hypothetical protein
MMMLLFLRLSRARQGHKGQQDYYARRSTSETYLLVT